MLSQDTQRICWETQPHCWWLAHPLLMPHYQGPSHTKQFVQSSVPSTRRMNIWSGQGLNLLDTDTDVDTHESCSLRSFWTGGSGRVLNGIKQKYYTCWEILSCCWRQAVSFNCTQLCLFDQEWKHKPVGVWPEDFSSLLESLDKFSFETRALVCVRSLRRAL